MIFISHKETDRALAQSLVEFLRASLDLPTESIRCTSVPGFQLPFGKTISAQLKDDIGGSNAVFVLITQYSLDSRWVLFEIGAAWALGRVIVPILGPGLSQADLPGPLAEYPVVRIRDRNVASRLRDAVAQVAKEIQLIEKTGGEPQDRLDSFVKMLSNWSSTVEANRAQALAFMIGWYVAHIFSLEPKRPAMVWAALKSSCSELGLELPETMSWEDLIRDDAHESFDSLREVLLGQLYARSPNLVTYIENGIGIRIAIAQRDVAAMAKIGSDLNLPKELREPTGNRHEWANQVRKYFEEVLRRLTG